jgi:hypothetical protein
MPAGTGATARQAYGNAEFPSTFPKAKGQKDSSMNDARRKVIGKIMDEIERLMGEVNAVLAEEQAAFENMLGGLPQSEKGETAEDAIGYLKQALKKLDEAIEELLCAQEPSQHGKSA